MKIAFSKADFPSLRGLLDRQLYSDETIRWCSYPSIECDKSSVLSYIFKLFSGVAIYCVVATFLVSLTDHSVALYPEIVAFGLGALFAIYMIVIWPCAVYAITTKRIIAVRWARIHSVDISQITSYSEVRNGAWTDLVFSLSKGGRIRFCGLSQRDISETIQPFIEELPRASS